MSELALINAMKALQLINKVAQYTAGTNMFNAATRTIGVFDSGGILNASALYDTSDFIPVSSGQSYAVTACRKVIFYNTSKVFSLAIDVPTVIAQVVTAPMDGFMRVSVRATDVGTTQVETGTFSTPYQPYGRKLTIPIDVINGLAQPTAGKNLFNQSTRSIGYFVQEASGALSASALYDTTDYIPIQPNTSYAMTTCRKIVFYNASKGFISGIDVAVPTPQVAVSPLTAAYMKVSFQASVVGGSQVEHGTTQTSYTPFGAGSGTYTLSQNVVIPAANIAGVSTVNTIDFTNVDRIGMIGDSYTEAIYPVRGKAYVNKLSLFSDYNFENFAQSGDTYRGNLDRIRKKNTIYHTTLSWQDFKPKYAFLVSYTNDLKYMDNAQYANDMRAVIETVRALGAIPIVATEYHSNFSSGILNTLRQVAREYGADFVDIIPKVAQLRGTDYADFWGGSHPGTRVNALEFDNYEKYLSQLPRPRQSIKVFRLRAGIAVSTLDDLVFNTNNERAKKFKEIMVGHNALIDPKYVDKVNAGTYSRVTSEYLMLQNKEMVSFSDYVLVSVVLPATARNVQTLRLVLSDTTPNVYVRNILASPYPSPTYYQRFDFTGSPTINVGDKYTSDNPNLTGTFTVGYVSGNSVFMTPANGNGYTGGAGTLTRTSGTGSASISYTYVAIGFDSAYPTGKQNIGHWQQVNLTNNKYDVPAALIADIVDYDKVHFLVQKTGAFTLNDIHVEWVGAEDKVYRSTELKLQEPEGTELMTQPFIGTTAQLATWTIEGTAAVYTPADGNLPSGCTGCIDITTANKVKQAVTYTSSVNDVEFEVKVWARYFPAISDPAGSTFTITEDTYDFAELAVDVVQGGTQVFTFKDKVNLHWKEVTFRGLFPAGTTTETFRIYSNDQTIQLAKVSVKRVSANA